MSNRARQTKESERYGERERESRTDSIEWILDRKDTINSISKPQMGIIRTLEKLDPHASEDDGSTSTGVHTVTLK